MWASPRGVVKSKLYGILIRREGSACTGCGLSARVQWPIDIQGRATWYKANAWRSVIDGLKGGRRKRGDGEGLHAREIAGDCLAAWGI